MKKYFILGLLIIFVSCEIILRYKCGFCDAPLFLSSNNYEYINAPSQHRFRFGNHSDYNQFSMRNDELDSAKIHILGLGDSVINGGAPTDQSELATTLVSKEMNIQMLNISAGSWGPDNCAAYLKEKGIFAAKAILLMVSSHDAHDIMDFQPVVDVHPSYPSKQYKLASWELIDRYLMPHILAKFSQKKVDPDQAVLQGIHKNGIGFNPGFDQLKTIADSVKIPLLIYLHAEQDELKKGKYNEEGMEIIQWAKNNNISLVIGLHDNIDESCYRDGIHLNAKGQRQLANSLEKIIQINHIL